MPPNGYISNPAYLATSRAPHFAATTMSSQASRRWIVHLPQTQYALACAHYGGDDAVRELLCAGLEDVMGALSKGQLSHKQLSEQLAVSMPPVNEATELVSVRVPLDTHFEFEAQLGVYGAKTAIMRYILDGLAANSVYTVHHAFVDQRRTVLVDILGGSRNGN